MTTATEKTRRKPETNCAYLGVVLNRRGQVLMIRRASGEIDWAFPGGKLKKGETRKACVRREVREETGYDVAVLGEISQRDRHPVSFAGIHYHVCYLNPDPQTPRPYRKDEVHEVKWLSPERVLEIARKLDERVRRFLASE